MKRHILGALLFVCASSQATAGPVVIEGMMDCGMWLKARKDSTSQSLEHVVLGFMNGLSFGGQREFWRAGGHKVGREQVFFWLDNYCQKNPMNDVYEGAIVLFRERSVATE